VAIIAAQLLGTINGGKINEFISFASSLASLILAVVAIFYAMISNQSFTETIGSLRLSASSVEQAAERVCDVTSDLGQKSDFLTSQLADFSPALSKVTERLDMIASPASSDVVPDGDHLKTKPELENETHGARVALFLAWLSHTNKKSFNVVDLFKDIEGGQSWADYVRGYLIALDAYHCLGLSIDKDIEGNVFNTVNKGSLDLEGIYARIGMLPNTDFFLTMKNKLESYFKPEVPSQQVEGLQG